MRVIPGAVHSWHTGMATAQLAMNTVIRNWQIFPAMLAGMGAGVALLILLIPVLVGLFGAMAALRLLPRTMAISGKPRLALTLEEQR